MFKYLIYRYLTFTGWTFSNNIPESLRSFVVVGAPHTSNWDFFPAMAGAYLLKRDPHFLIKNTMMGLPIAAMLKFLGAIGVDRESIQEGKALHFAEFLNTQKDFVLMLAPEGTRKATTKWKSGFWYIAKNANVPIVLGFLDYDKKSAGFGKIIEPREFESDMKEIMAFYKDKSGYIKEFFKLDERF